MECGKLISVCLTTREIPPIVGLEVLGHFCIGDTEIRYFYPKVQKKTLSGVIKLLDFVATGRSPFAERNSLGFFLCLLKPNPGRLKN